MKRYQRLILFVVAIGMFQQCLVLMGFNALFGGQAIAQTQAKPKAAPAKYATLIVKTKSTGATISLYRLKVKAQHTPATFTSLKPGEVYICADPDGSSKSQFIETYYKSVTLKAGKTTRVTIDFNKPDDGPPEGDGGPGTPTPMDKLLSAIPYRAKHFTVSDAPNPARYAVM